MGLRRIRYIPLLAVLIGTSSGDASSADERNWIEINAGDRFVLSAPPGTTYIPLQGVDSFVGELVNAEFRIGLPYGRNFVLHFDHGSYSNDLHSERNSPNYITEQIVVDGRVGMLVTSRIRVVDEFCNGYRTGMHVVAIRRLRTGAPVSLLTIFGCVMSEDQIQLVHRMFETIRFPQA